MEADFYLKQYARYANLSDAHKSMAAGLYEKFKSTNSASNKALARYILMFVASGVFYRGRDFAVDVSAFSRPQVDAIIRCCSKTMPESGTFYGIQMCQMYNMPRQQNNLNVKKPKTDAAADLHDGDRYPAAVDFDDADEWIRVNCTDPVNKQIFSSPVFKDYVERFHARDKNDLFLSMSQPKVIYTSYMVKTAGPVVEAYAKMIRECVRYCMCVELKKITGDSMTFVAYHVNKSFFERFTYGLHQMFGAGSIVIWFTNERTIFTKKYGGEYFVRNYVDFLYCFMTNRFEPDAPRTLNDIVTMMTCKLISGIIKSIKFASLKSTGLYRAGYTPMSLITTEASLLNIRKLVNESDANCRPASYSIYTPSESMFANAAVSRDNITIHAKYD